MWASGGKGVVHPDHNNAAQLVTTNSTDSVLTANTLCLIIIVIRIIIIFVIITHPQL